jgi:hypothetical protein
VEAGLVERMLRELPGVLDCSVSDEGIAIVVHPEVDPRLMELRAQTALAEVGERRHLLVVGGMSTADAPASPPPAPSSRGMHVPRNRSSMPLVGFVVLVVAALTVLPLANRDAPPTGDRLGGGATVLAAPPTPATGSAAAPQSASRPFGPVSVSDDRVAAALAPTVVRPLGAVTATVGFLRRAVAAASDPARPQPVESIDPATTVGTATPAVPAPAPAPVVQAPAQAGAKAGLGGGDRKHSAVAAESGGSKAGKGATVGKADKPDRPDKGTGAKAATGGAPGRGRR